MTRAEYVKLCKLRAIEIARSGNLNQAVFSMLSDIRKQDQLHPDSMLGLLMLDGLYHAKRNDFEGVLRWINESNWEGK